MIFSSDFVKGLIDKYGYPFVSGVIRLVRAMTYVAVTAGLVYATEHIGDLSIPTAWQATVLATLLGVDKWLREHKAAIEGVPTA